MNANDHKELPVYPIYVAGLTPDQLRIVNDYADSRRPVDRFVIPGLSTETIAAVRDAIREYRQSR